MYLGSEVVEIAPSSSRGSSELEVKVNGAHRHVSESSPVHIGEICKIHKEAGMIHISAEKLGVKVSTNGEKIHIHVSGLITRTLTFSPL